MASNRNANENLDPAYRAIPDDQVNRGLPVRRTIGSGPSEKEIDGARIVRIEDQFTTPDATRADAARGYAVVEKITRRKR